MKDIRIHQFKIKLDNFCMTDHFIRSLDFTNITVPEAFKCFSFLFKWLPLTVICTLFYIPSATLISDLLYIYLPVLLLY